MGEKRAKKGKKFVPSSSQEENREDTMSQFQRAQIEDIESLPGPLKAIRRKCLDCMNDSSPEVSLCTSGDVCTLYPYRFGRGPEVRPELSPLKAIREKCAECSAGDKAERRRCEFTECSLWPYRMGHNPKRAGMGNKAANVQKNISLAQKT